MACVGDVWVSAAGWLDARGFFFFDVFVPVVVVTCNVQRQLMSAAQFSIHFHSISM